MKSKLIILCLCFVLLLFGIALYTKNPKSVPQPAVQSAQIVVLNPKPSKCVSVNGLPDKDCTPGAADPNVTQDNIHETICVSGYTSKVRPPVSYTNKLKIQQIGEYGFTDTNLSGYEEDHLIPLEIGGSPSDPANLWPEPGNIPNPKDKIENLCNQKVCDGQIELQLAQSEISSDWHTACQ